tara:strand:+ start:18308 stop:18892 length:585 start_codon:yes stop_codon:yes gene_type:complete
LLVFCLFLISCNRQKEEVIDLSDIIKESENYKEGETTSEFDTDILDTSEMVLDDFTENGLDVSSYEILDDKLFPDRFGPKSSSIMRLNFEKDTVFYGSWSFEDSSKTVNAFFNWLDNFGKKHKSIFIGEEKNLQKKPFLMFIGNNSLIFVESNEFLSKPQWENYLENKGYKEDWYYILQQRKWGKVKWLLDLEK